MKATRAGGDNRNALKYVDFDVTRRTYQVELG